MRLRTRLRSAAMRVLASTWYLEKQRSSARRRRLRAGQPSAVHYFHQVDDPYSHLVDQKLDLLRNAYRLPFENHLVSGPEPEFQGSSEHFDAWALRDAASIAADYGTSFDGSAAPAPEAVRAANDLLAPHVGGEDFAEAAVSTGGALWGGTLTARGSSLGDAEVQSGNDLREALGHYQGGMFYFDGEWFWGIDRIRTLEARLRDEGFGDKTAPLCVPEPEGADTATIDAQHVTLEYFPSLRSPYTAVGHRRVLDLVARSGVALRLRPVMPMLMRGIPAPRAKQRYIVTDAAREARARGVPFGRIVDPFGDPVRRAFALFPAAMELGKGLEFVTAYLAAAWMEGVDISTVAGLRRVAQTAGIDWAALDGGALDRAADSAAAWEEVLDDNLDAMLGAGLWGVPSFRVSGGSGSAPFACWGQDRIWRVANEIARRA